MVTARQTVAPPDGGFVLGVLGASGGVGASALATACATRAARAGRDVVLVDARPWSGGIDVLAGLDAAPGLRWPDLAGVRGDVDPQRLLEELPVSEIGFRCLSWAAGALQGQVPGPDPVLSALRLAAAVTVVDLPGPASAGGQEPWWVACDELVLVVDASMTGLGAAIVLAEACSPTGVVLRTPTHLAEEEIVTVVGAPLLACLEHDRAVTRCLEQGAPIGNQHGGLAEAADRLLSAVLPGLRAA